MGLKNHDDGLNAGANCLACRWCRFTPEPYGGCHYSCSRTAAQMSSSVVDRQSCPSFLELDGVKLGKNSG